MKRSLSAFVTKLNPHRLQLLAAIAATLVLAGGVSAIVTTEADTATAPAVAVPVP